MHTPLAVREAASLGWRAAVAGGVLLVLPPTGELPERWQVAVALPVCIAVSYASGLFGRHHLKRAAFEGLALLWLAVRWSALFAQVS